MKFKKVFPDLINSEGCILGLAENVSDECERLYLKCLCLDSRYSLFVSVNEKTLEMYFQSRINLIEICILRSDSKFILEDNHTHQQTLVSFDSAFEQLILRTLSCGKLMYHQVPLQMRLGNPFDTVMHFVHRNYINSFVFVSSNEYTGSKFVEDHPELFK